MDGLSSCRSGVDSGTRSEREHLVLAMDAGMGSQRAIDPWVQQNGVASSGDSRS